MRQRDGVIFEAIYYVRRPRTSSPWYPGPKQQMLCFDMCRKRAERKSWITTPKTLSSSHTELDLQSTKNQHSLKLKPQLTGAAKLSLVTMPD